MNKKSRRARCQLRGILQGPELLSESVLVEMEKMYVMKSSQWQNLLFKVSAGLDCVFCTRNILRHNTRQSNSGLSFLKRRQAKTSQNIIDQ